MIKFAHSEYLLGLCIIPLLILLFWWGMFRNRKALEQFGNPALLSQLMTETSKYKRTFKFFLLIFGMFFLVIALANPQIGTKMEEVKREGVDIMIAIDVSNSMRAEDIKPNRLESAKQEINRLINRLQNDRIGLIVFAGESYLQLPLTSDFSSARLLLSAIDVDIVPIQGTAIGSAIRLAMKSFVEGEKKHKVIIVISDGENHEDDAITAAKEAHSEGAIVHTMGMGTPEGVPIPIYENNQRIGFKKDKNNNIIMTKLDEAGLQQIASAGGGKYIRATTGGDELGILMKEIESMEKKEFGAKIFTEYEDRFQYFLIIALFLVVLEFFTVERKNRLLSKWNIFKTS